MNEKTQKILKGLWIATQYELAVVGITALDYLLGLDWGFAGQFGAIAIPLIINTIRQALKDSTAK